MFHIAHKWMTRIAGAFAVIGLISASIQEARADYWETPNAAGGNIILFDFACITVDNGRLQQAVLYTSSGATVFGCWGIIDDDHVMALWAMPGQSSPSPHTYPKSGWVHHAGSYQRQSAPAHVM